jgi:hypothetical protein
MPLGAKFLAFLNIIAAGGFVYLAAIDLSMRQAWSLEVFRQEVLLNGLPADQSDAVHRVDRSLYSDLSNATLASMFKNKNYDAGPVVSTLQEEAQRVKDGLKGEKDVDKLRTMILDQGTTVERRDELYQKTEYLDANGLRKILDADSLRKILGQMIDEAMSFANPDNPDKYDPELARQRMAHILYNMGQEAHQRVMVVVGMRAYIREAELQAANLREMAARSREIMVKDRAHFEAEFLRLVARVFVLSEQVEDMKLALKTKQDIRERVDVELKGREGEKAKLLMDLAKAKADTGVALEEQAALEKYLFEINTELGRYKDHTEKMERELRALEVRGGR